MPGVLDDLKQLGNKVFKDGLKGVESLAQAIDHQAEIGRLAARLRRLNNERNQAVMEIGKKTYALHTRGQVTNADVLAECRRVDELTAQIGQLRDEIDRLRRQPGADALKVEISDQSPLSDTAAVGDQVPDAAPESAPTSSATVAAETPPPAAASTPEDEPLRPAPSGCEDE